MKILISLLKLDRLVLGVSLILSLLTFPSYADVMQVQGVVVQSETREALSNVSIELTENGQTLETYHLKPIATFNIEYDFKEDADYRLLFTKENYGSYQVDLSSSFQSGKMPQIMKISLAKSVSSFTFTGQAIDRYSNSPVRDAKVTFTNTLTGESLKTDVDLEGKYTLKVVSGYEYDIEVQSGKFLKRFAKINYCSDTLENKNKYCFSGFSDVGLDKNGGISAASILMDKINIGTKFKVDNIYYDYNKATLRPDAIPNLRKVLYVLKDNPQIIIELGSHADSRGSDQYNLKLSQRRAISAVKYIIDQGAGFNRITAKGYGETQLVNHCTNGVKCSNKEHEDNRRTEFIIIGIDETKL